MGIYEKGDCQWLRVFSLHVIHFSLSSLLGIWRVWCWGDEDGWNRRRLLQIVRKSNGLVLLRRALPVSDSNHPRPVCNEVKMMKMKTKTTPPPPTTNGNSAAGEWEVRPGGMLVQKRTDSDQTRIPPPTIRVRVKYGSVYHEVNISSQASFGIL